jgi:hypothetical protein
LSGLLALLVWLWQSQAESFADPILQFISNEEVIHCVFMSGVANLVEKKKLFVANSFGN